MPTKSGSVLRTQFIKLKVLKVHKANSKLYNFTNFINLWLARGACDRVPIEE